MTKKELFEWRAKEYLKCKHNPIYFIENYVQLPLPGGNTLMSLYQPQKKFIQSIVDDHFVIALKSRQVGVSTCTQAYCCYVCTFFKNVVFGIVSKSGSESTSFCRKVRDLLHNLPDWLQPKFEKESEQTFILKNGCWFEASQVNASNPSKLFRGPATTVAIIDEAAHTEHIDEAFIGFGPSLVKSQKIARQRDVPFATILISTPNRTTGIGRWYFEKWSEASDKSKESIYVSHKIHWSMIKEFREDPDWYKQQCAILHNDPDIIAQELEMKFIASTNSFFGRETVDKLNSVGVEPVAKMHLEGHDLWQWERPMKDLYYLIGVDTASQSGRDNSAIQVFDFQTFEQIAEYKGKLRVDDFCKVIDMISKIYRNNMIVVESNSYGNQVVEHLTRRRESYNIYQQTIKNKKYSRFNRYRYGLSTNALTRPLIIDAMFTYVTEHPEMVKSERLALELIGLERSKTGKIQAGRGEQDDMAMALGFIAYVRMYDAPLNVTTRINSEVIEDAVDTIDLNFGDDVASTGIIGIRHEEKMTQNEANLAVQKHIKHNLHKLVKDGGAVDITKILGFNIITQDRDNNLKKNL